MFISHPQLLPWVATAPCAVWIVVLGRVRTGADLPPAPYEFQLED